MYILWTAPGTFVETIAENIGRYLDVGNVIHSGSITALRNGYLGPPSFSKFLWPSSGKKWQD